MSEQQMLWAKQHDWFIRIGYRYGHNQYCIVCRNDIKGEVSTTKAFTDYKELRQWAGY